MIKQIQCDGKAEYEFLKELSKRSGETDRKVTQIVTEIIGGQGVHQEVRRQSAAVL